MGNLLPLIIVGFLVYLVFFRKGGMGCCGGHRDHDPWHVRHSDSDRRPYPSQEGEVIDLREDQYTVLSSGDDDFPEKQGKRSDDKSAWLN